MGCQAALHLGRPGAAGRLCTDWLAGGGTADGATDGSGAYTIGLQLGAVAGPGGGAEVYRHWNYRASLEARGRAAVGALEAGQQHEPTLWQWLGGIAQLAIEGVTAEQPEPESTSGVGAGWVAQRPMLGTFGRTEVEVDAAIGALSQRLQRHPFVDGMASSGGAGLVAAKLAAEWARRQAQATKNGAKLEKLAAAVQAEVHGRLPNLAGLHRAALARALRTTAGGGGADTAAAMARELRAASCVSVALLRYEEAKLAETLEVCRCFSWGHPAKVVASYLALVDRMAILPAITVALGHCIGADVLAMRFLC